VPHKGIGGSCLEMLLVHSVYVTALRLIKRQPQLTGRAPDAVVRVAIIEHVLERQRRLLLLPPQKHLPLAVRAAAGARLIHV